MISCFGLVTLIWVVFWRLAWRDGKSRQFNGTFLMQQILHLCSYRKLSQVGRLLG
jgi:hypothetical protein